MKEFAYNGYKKSSTNQIVKNAGIGKGMLFYYFKSKNRLYLYLIDYAIDMTINEYLSLIVSTERNFIERIKQAAQVKLRFSHERPYVFQLLKTVVLVDELKLPKDLEERLFHLKKMTYSKLNDNVDLSLFRDNIEVEKTCKLIEWIINEYQNELFNHIKGQWISNDVEQHWKKFSEYLNVLKLIFYTN